MRGDVASDRAPDQVRVRRRPGLLGSSGTVVSRTPASLSIVRKVGSPFSPRSVSYRRLVGLDSLGQTGLAESDLGGRQLALGKPFPRMARWFSRRPRPSARRLSWRPDRASVRPCASRRSNSASTMIWHAQPTIHRCATRSRRWAARPANLRAGFRAHCARPRQHAGIGQVGGATVCGLGVVSSLRFSRFFAYAFSRTRRSRSLAKEACRDGSLA